MLDVGSKEANRWSLDTVHFALTVVFQEGDSINCFHHFISVTMSLRINQAYDLLSLDGTCKNKYLVFNPELFF